MLKGERHHVHLSQDVVKGLLKGERHHVHLSQDVETARQVAQRRGSVVILQIDSAAMHAQGMAFYCSSNGVWLTDFVPSQFLSTAEEPFS